MATTRATAGYPSPTHAAPHAADGAAQREAVQSDCTAPAAALAAVAADWHVQTWFGQGCALGQQCTAANVFDAGGHLAFRTSAYDGSGTTRTGQINSKVRGARSLLQL
jgi:hypothetical protein